MANNFKLPGDRFASKAGTAGAAATRDAPVTSLQELQDTAALANVIGTGVYESNGLNALAGALQTERQFYADGNVVIRGSNITLVRWGYSIISGYDLTWQGPMAVDSINYGHNATAGHFRSIFQNVAFGFTAGGTERGCVYFFEDCILIGCTGVPELAVAFNRCILINCTFNNVWNLTNCYGDGASTARMDFTTSGGTIFGNARLTNQPVYLAMQNQRQATNNNWRGQLATGATGNLADVATWQAQNSSNASGNVSQEPNFNRPDAGDYTLRLSSPHLNSGIGPAHLRYALSYYVEFDGAPGDLCTISNTRLRSTTGATVAFLEIGGFTVNEQGGFVIATNTSGNFEGYYTTDRIRVAAVAQPIDLLPVVFAANYDTDYPTTEAAFSSSIPQPHNNNVPVRNNFASGQAGRNPHRLTIQARFSPNAFPDLNQSSDWEGGVFFDFEIGAKPTYNAATGLGNGHPAYDPTPANVSQVEARWLQYKFRARNNYFSR